MNDIQKAIVALEAYSYLSIEEMVDETEADFRFKNWLRHKSDESFRYLVDHAVQYGFQPISPEFPAK